MYALEKVEIINLNNTNAIFHCFNPRKKQPLGTSLALKAKTLSTTVSYTALSPMVITNTIKFNKNDLKHQW